MGGDLDVTQDILEFTEFAGVNSRADLTIQSFYAGTLITDPDGNTLWLAHVTDAQQINFEFRDNDPIFTGGPNSVVMGTNDDDIFVNGEGTQYVFAHKGNDTYKVDGNRADYNITKTLDGTGYVIWSADEFDMFWDMEHVEFADEIVDLGVIV